MKNKVIVMVLSPTGLSVARSLAPRGVQVYGVDCIRTEIGHFSKWVQHDERISFLPPGEALLDGLIQFGEECSRKPVLFIAGDPYMDFVARHREALKKFYILADSMTPDILSVFLNKKTFYERCADLSVEMPNTFFPETDDDVIIASKHLSYPAILKPSLGYMLRDKLNGQKLIEISTPGELISWWRKLKNWGADSVIQEKIEGAESNIVVAGLYTDQYLDCRSCFTARKIRQNPPYYGSGSYMVSEWNAEIAAKSIKLVKDLGYQGICGTEYKYDIRDNCWKLIEINCRPTLWFALTRAAGVDVVWDAYCDSIGSPNPIRIGGQKENVKWQFLIRDLVSSIHYLKSGHMKFHDFFRTVLNPMNKEYAVLSKRDLNTMIGYPIYAAQKFFSNIV